MAYAQRSGPVKIKGKGCVRTARVDEAVAVQQVYSYLHRVEINLRERDNADIGRLRPLAHAERVKGTRHGKRRRKADGRGNC